jgi:hypothetical protein
MSFFQLPNIRTKRRSPMRINIRHAMCRATWHADTEGQWWAVASLWCIVLWVRQLLFLLSNDRGYRTRHIHVYSPKYNNAQYRIVHTYGRIHKVLTYVENRAVSGVFRNIDPPPPSPPYGRIYRRWGHFVNLLYCIFLYVTGSLLKLILTYTLHFNCKIGTIDIYKTSLQ